MSTTQSDAKQYARIRYRLILVGLVGWFGFLAAYQILGCSAGVSAWLALRTSNYLVQVAGFLAVFGVVYYLVFFPLHVYQGFLLEHRFGLSRLTWPGWLWREAKHVLVSAGLSLPLFLGLYALLRYAPKSWPVWAALGWVVFSVLLARIFPTVLLPLFYKVSPLQDEALVARLLRLCEQTGLSALGVFRMDLGAETRKANAALAGLGSTKRVLLSDTLLERFGSDEIETVLAHELGHQRYRHMNKLLVLSGLGSLVAFSLIHAASALWIEPLGLAGLTDLAGFPLLMVALSLINVLGLPLQNGLSRHFEWQADRFAVTATKQSRAFASALKKLAELNLADPSPPRWVEVFFYDHPPISKRIAFAESAS